MHVVLCAIAGIGFWVFVLNAYSEYYSFTNSYYHLPLYLLGIAVSILILAYYIVKIETQALIALVSLIIIGIPNAIPSYFYTNYLLKQNSDFRPFKNFIEQTALIS